MIHEADSPEREIEVSFSMKPEEQKMTEEAKAVVRILCKEKPWRKEWGKNFDIPQVEWKVPAPYGDKPYALNCLNGIGVTYTCELGVSGKSYGGASAIVGIRYDGDKSETILYLIPLTCECFFQNELPYLLDKSDSWDEIISSKKKRKKR